MGVGHHGEILVLVKKRSVVQISIFLVLHSVEI